MNARVNPNDIPENQYAIGRRMKVRKLDGVYEIVDSWMIGKNRRYRLRAVVCTGAVLPETEAYGSDMQPAPEPEPTQEITLVPDPDTGETTPVIRAATAAQEPASPAAHADLARAVERAAADAIRSPDGFDTYEPGAFGGELDPYSPGANLEDPGELQREPLTPVRRFPRKTTYAELGNIVYSARLKGLEHLSSEEIDDLDPETPVAVVLTQENNGHAIWIITSRLQGRADPEATLEVFYPEADGSKADAIEYAVLIALRQVPISFIGVIETSRLVR